MSDGENDPLELRLIGSGIPEAITSSSGQIKVKFTRNSNNTSPFNSTTNSARWQARYKFLADENQTNQSDTINSKKSTTEEF